MNRQELREDLPANLGTYKKEDMHQNTMLRKDLTKTSVEIQMVILLFGASQLIQRKTGITASQWRNQLPRMMTIHIVEQSLAFGEMVTFNQLECNRDNLVIVGSSLLELPWQSIQIELEHFSQTLNIQIMELLSLTFSKEVNQ